MSTTNIQPLGDKVAVKPMDKEEKTSGGLFLPESAKEKPMRGKVIAVGKGQRNNNGDFIGIDIKIGDEVLYGKYGGTTINIDDQEVIILKESDVLATLS